MSHVRPRRRPAVGDLVTWSVKMFQTYSFHEIYRDEPLLVVSVTQDHITVMDSQGEVGPGWKDEDLAAVQAAKPSHLSSGLE